MSRLLFGASVLVLAVPSLGMTHARSKISTDDTPSPAQICWTDGSEQQCIPLSIVRATFQGYQQGGAPPVNQVRQDLIAAQAQLAEALKTFRQCEGTLGPLQAQAHQAALQQQQQRLNEDNAKAAPPGMSWDTKANHYVLAPAPDMLKKGRQ